MWLGLIATCGRATGNMLANSVVRFVDRVDDTMLDKMPESQQSALGSFTSATQQQLGVLV